MTSISITDVRVLPADSAFLIDDGETSILYDTGFAFTGYGVLENVRSHLGDRELDYIFLTHSHYDHALGSPYVLKHYPRAKVVAGEYAKKIFSKSTARAVMRDLDQKFAKTCGVFDYEDLIDELRVDISVCDGDTVLCGNMEFTAIELPGHTKCSVGFYLKKEGLLLATETLGVYCGQNTYVPSYLVGYRMTLDSFRKVEALDVKKILLPHYGLIDGEECQIFLRESKQKAITVAEKIADILSKGGTVSEAEAYSKDTLYTDVVRPLYPIDAFELNTHIMVELIKKELC